MAKNRNQLLIEKRKQAQKKKEQEKAVKQRRNTNGTNKAGVQPPAPAKPKSNASTIQTVGKPLTQESRQTRRSEASKLENKEAKRGSENRGNTKKVNTNKNNPRFKSAGEFVNKYRTDSGTVRSLNGTVFDKGNALAKETASEVGLDKRDTNFYSNKTKFSDDKRMHTRGVMEDEYNKVKLKHPEMTDNQIYTYLSEWGSKQGYGEDYAELVAKKIEESQYTDVIRSYVDKYGEAEGIVRLQKNLAQQNPTERNQKIRESVEAYLLDKATKASETGNVAMADEYRMMNRKFQDATPTDNFGGKLWQATSAGLGSGMAGVGVVLTGGNDTLEDAVRTYQQQQMVAKQGASALGGAILDIANVAGMQVPALLAGGVPGLAIMGTGSAGQKYVNAIDNGATQQEAVTTAVATGLLESIAFTLPIKALRTLKGMPKAKVTDELVNAMKDTTLFKSIAKKAVRGAGAEILSEGLTAFASDLADEIIYTDNIEKAGGFLPWVMKNGGGWLYEGAIGGAFGFTAGAVAGASNYYQAQNYKADLINNIVEQFDSANGITDGIANAMVQSSQTEGTANAIVNAANGIKEMNEQAKAKKIQEVENTPDEQIVSMQESLEQPVEQQPNEELENKKQNWENGGKERLAEWRAERAVEQQMAENEQSLPNTTSVNEEIDGDNTPNELTEYEQDLLGRILNKGFVSDSDIDGIEDVYPALMNELRRVTGNPNIQSGADVQAFMNGEIENVVEQTVDNEIGVDNTVSLEDNNDTGGDINGNIYQRTGDDFGSVINRRTNQNPTEGVQGYARMPEKLGKPTRRYDKMVQLEDSNGRRLAKREREKIQGTSVIDNNGKPIPVYHYTPNREFMEFTKGETGIHFGTLAQALDRQRHKYKNPMSGKIDEANLTGRLFKSYINVKNPAVLENDTFSWIPEYTAMALFRSGVITEQEAFGVWELAQADFDQSYNGKAATALRELLKSKNYDGIKYKNDKEGSKKDYSYIVFDNDQIVTFEITNSDLNPETGEIDNSQVLWKPEPEIEQETEVKNEQTKTRSYPKSVLESPNIDEDTEQSISDMINDGTFNYVVQSNQKLVDKVNTELEDLDLEQSYQRVLGSFSSGKLPKSEDIARAEVVLVKAISEGNTDVAESLIVELAEAGTELGRAVQALYLIKRLSPAGRLMAVERAVEKINNSIANSTPTGKNKQKIKNARNSEKRIKKIAQDVGKTDSIALLTSQHRREKLRGEVREAKQIVNELEREINRVGRKQYETWWNIEVAKGNVKVDPVEKVEKRTKTPVEKALDKPHKLNEDVADYNRRTDNVDEKDLKKIEKVDEKAFDLYKEKLGLLNFNIPKDVTALQSMTKQLNSMEAELKSLEDNIRALEKEQKQRNRDIDQLGMELPENIKNNILQAKTQEEIDAAMEEAKKYIGEHTPATFSDKFDAWRYLAMLGNPRTHFRNLVGNALMYGGRKTSNMLSALAQDVFVKGEGKTRTLKKATSSQTEFAEAEYEKAKEMIEIGGKYGIDFEINQYKTIFDNKHIEKLRKKNMELLGREDAKFSKPAFVDALANYMRANNLEPEFLKSDSNEAIEQYRKAVDYAVLEAQRATYREANAVATALRRIENSNTPKKGVNVAGKILVAGTIPFKKTPLNIAKRSIEYSPLGVIKGVGKLNERAKQLAEQGETTIEAGEIVDAFTESATGTAAMIVGALLAHLDLLRGAGDEEKDERYYKQDLGVQDYALNFGDFTFSISWAAPIAVPLFVGAEAYNVLNSAKDSDSKNVFGRLVGAIANMGEPLIEMSCFNGIMNVLETNSNEDTTEQVLSMLGTVASNYTGQFIPTIFGQLARVVDGTRRNTYTNNKNAVVSKEVDTWLKKLANKVPGLSYANEPYIDKWGREVVDGNIGFRFFENFLSPGYIEKRKDSEVDKEIQRLFDITGENGLIPKSPDVKITYDSKEYVLGGSEYTDYKRKYGNVAYKNLEQVISSDEYKSLSDEDKVKVIEEVYDYSHTVVKENVLKGKGIQMETDSWVQAIKNNNPKKSGISTSEAFYIKAVAGKFDEPAISYYKDAKASGMDFADYTIHKSQLGSMSSDENGKKQQKIINYINGLDITNKQKRALWSIEYDSTKNMPGSWWKD